jgi:hypothetical protein
VPSSAAQGLGEIRANPGKRTTACPGATCAASAATPCSTGSTELRLSPALTAISSRRPLPEQRLYASSGSHSRYPLLPHPSLNQSAPQMAQREPESTAPPEIPSATIAVSQRERCSRSATTAKLSASRQRPGIRLKPLARRRSHRTDHGEPQLPLMGCGRLRGTGPPHATHRGRQVYEFHVRRGRPEPRKGCPCHGCARRSASVRGRPVAVTSTAEHCRAFSGRSG